MVLQRKWKSFFRMVCFVLFLFCFSLLFCVVLLVKTLSCWKQGRRHCQQKKVRKTTTGNGDGGEFGGTEADDEEVDVL